MSHIFSSIGQLLESALEVADQVARTSVSMSPLPYSTMMNQFETFGTETRKKLSNCLAYDNQFPKACAMSLPPATEMSAVDKILRQEPANNTWLALWLPPSSPFDNFLRAFRAEVRFHVRTDSTTLFF